MRKSNLLLLHGALGSASQFDILIPHINSHFVIHRFDFEGHGTQLFPGRLFQIEHFAENVLAYLDAQQIEQVDMFGYSMGGYVAVYLASIQPERVSRIMTLGTKYLWTPEAARFEMGNLLPEKIFAKVPAFARALEEQHTGAGWRQVVNNTHDMIGQLGDRNLITEEVLKGIESAVRVVVGDRDTTISIGEATIVYGTLQHGELEILPGTPHPLDRVAPARLAASIIEWFGADH